MGTKHSRMIRNRPGWYSVPAYWRVLLPFAYLWKNVGYYSVFYVAAIAGISTDFYEAAQLDITD